MVKFLNRCVQIILLCMLILIIASIIVKGSLLEFVFFIASLGLSYLIYRFYKKDKIKPKAMIIISIILLLLGLVIRLYYMFKLDIILDADFELYYETAKSIANGVTVDRTWYLSFNGYVYIFATILSLAFRLFGSSIVVALFFNLFCQIGTVLVLDRVLQRFVKKEVSYLLCSIWFILPTVVEANLLISTETLFILIFVIFIWLYFKWKDVKELNYKMILKYILLGLIMSLCNNIRPVMSIFVIALLVDYILNLRKLNKGLCILSMLVIFVLSNFGLSKYVEVGLKEPSRRGALEWSLYYGASYEHGGYWNEDDSIKISEFLNQENGSKLLLQATIKRYKDMGIVKSSLLFAKKYYHLWGDVNGNYNFLLLDVSEEKFYSMKDITDAISYVVVLLLIIISIKNVILEFKTDDKSKLFLELFFVGYILANMLVVVNGRYNFPGWLILIILCAYPGSIKLKN